MAGVPVTKQKPRASDSTMVIDLEVTSESSTAAVEADKTIDDDHESSSDERSTIASCKACNTDFAEFYNCWVRITGSYYLPSLQGSYRITALHGKNKPKLAAEQSALSGCTIRSLVCSNCNDPIAIVCIKAPESKHAYAERDFFKLPKIQLRSETTGKFVDPIIEGDHQATSPKNRPLEATSMERPGDVAVTTVQKPLLPSMSVLGHKTQEDLQRNDLTGVRTVPSQPLQPKPAMPEREAQIAPQIRAPGRAIASATSSNSQVHVNGLAADIVYPSNLTVKLDAIDRLQTQVNLNRATLESCTRDITRLEGSFRQLHTEFKETVEAVRMELFASRQHAVATAAAIAPQGDRLDDQTLEVFSSTLSQVVSKANEVDALKVQFEIIKRKLKRLEEGNVSPAAAAPVYPSHGREISMQHTPVIQHVAQAQVARMPSSESRTLPSQPASRVTYTPEAPHPSQHQEHAQTAAAGWVPVNTGMKRGPGGPDNGADVADTPIGSPKRAKLAPLEPRYKYEAQATTTPIRYERVDTDESIATRTHRTASHDTYPDTTNPASFVPHTQDGVSDDSWRPASQRAVSGPAMPGTSPRGRGRGRGRGGRPRKSMPLEPHMLATPEWEKEGWTGSQVEADGFYRGGVARRGSGGGPAIGLSPTQAFDPYGHTKRARTKPIRNADGVLIRKDGRPDLRSQSSAMNLRKVHAKKEEERQGSVSGSTGPMSGLAGESAMIAESPASTDSHDVEMSSTQERAEHIMKQMFPKGVEQERARLYTAQQYFPSEQSPAGTAAGTPIQRSVSESEFADSIEAEKARDDTPQQRDEPMEDQPAEETATVQSTTTLLASTDSHTLQADTQAVPGTASTET